MQTVRDTVIGVLADAADCPAETISAESTIDSLRLDSLELLQVGLNLEDHYGPAAYIGGDDWHAIQAGTVQGFIDFITRRI